MSKLFRTKREFNLGVGGFFTGFVFTCALIGVFYLLDKFF